tara:strand:+ start:1193 stop:1369 length:177 start_codon:yes stop_codon:yes gene_type:complete
MKTLVRDFRDRYANYTQSKQARAFSAIAGDMAEAIGRRWLRAIPCDARRQDNLEEMQQ